MRSILVYFVAILLASGPAAAQAQKRQPYIGYAYPAGAQQGATIRLTVCGQHLRGAREIHLTGEGVKAKYVQRLRSTRLNSKQRIVLLMRLVELAQKRLEELGLPERVLEQVRTRIRVPKPKNPEELEHVKLPKHQLLMDLESKSLRELLHVKEVFMFPRFMIRPNRQLGETILIEVQVAPDAPPGNRELRIQCWGGVTNPIVFQVGQHAEHLEMEPNTNRALELAEHFPQLAEHVRPDPIQLPAVLNGQIMPGDRDRFRFHAAKGQKLVIRTDARRLVPYLADAVPGWFQPVVKLYDAAGKELAYADDFRFDPDPALFFQVPETGDYEFEIHDAIYRGRQDFVYRITIGELPFITSFFPLGASVGQEQTVQVRGWNLRRSEVRLDTSDSGVRMLSCTENGIQSNELPYVVGRTPEIFETGKNDSLKTARTVSMPLLVNGRIETVGDADHFAFTAQKGDRIVIEVAARRLQSPLDSLIRVFDANGKVLAWNDDSVQRLQHLHLAMEGSNTHHADSYLLVDIPEDGRYTVQISDTRQHGGAAFGYRLRIAPATPDFDIRVTPSSLTALRNGYTPLELFVTRKEGFDAPIELALVDAPPGFSIQQPVIPPGCIRYRCTLYAPFKPDSEPLALNFEGRARIGDRLITRSAQPADDVMQAFLYRHLMPAEHAVFMPSERAMATIKLEPDGLVQIRPGETKSFLFRTRKRPDAGMLRIELESGPTGIAIGDLAAVEGGYSFTVAADADAAKAGPRENLIIGLFVEREVKPKKKDLLTNKEPEKTSSSRKTIFFPLGHLPAVPIQVVK